MNDKFLDQMGDEKQTLLIVEDDVGLQSQLRWHYEEYNVVVASNRADALAALRREQPAVVLQDLGLPPDEEGVEEGFATLEESLTIDPSVKVVVVTGHADYDNALRAVSMGAYDFYQKPVNTQVLDLIVQRAFQMARLEHELRKQQEEGKSPLEGIVANNPMMVKLCRSIEKIAPTNVTTLLLGESGTGKEVFARAIHNLSEYKDNLFVAINCAAVPETLIESELFGYEKGAFTGANKQTLGKIETAKVITSAADSLIKKIDTWETAIIESRTQNGQDVINWPSKLNVDFFHLKGLIDVTDPKVTQGVKNKLADLQLQWKNEKEKVQGINTAVAEFNALYKNTSIEAIQNK